MHKPGEHRAEAISRRGMLWATAFLASSLGAESASADDRPNLIFVLTDDQRRDTLGCYGNRSIATPELDLLAAQGVLFDNASVTSAICTPSRACYFLGQYERRHGVNFNSATTLDEAAWSRSFPALLGEAGYFLGYVGKNHVPVGPKGYGGGALEQTFDLWYAAHGHLGFYPKKEHAIFRHAHADTQVEVLQQAALSVLNPSASFIAGARSFFDKRPTDRPFCLSICFNVPHGHGTGSMRMLPTDPEIYRTEYRDQIDSMPIPDAYVAKREIDRPKLPPDVLYASYRQEEYDYVDDPASLRERMIRQYQTVTGIDRMVGAVRACLEKHGIADNTVIVFTSDHGLMLGEHGLGGKALNYEACLNVPMLIYDPRLPRGSQGRRVKELVQSIDVAPTLLDMAGLPASESMQGNSLAPLLRAEGARWREHAFAENLWSTYFGNPRIESVRGRRWKYIRYFENDRTPWRVFEEGRNPYENLPDQASRYSGWLDASIEGEKPVYEELFDLRADPSERDNLADDPAHLPTLDRLRAECRRQVAAARKTHENQR